MARNPLPDLLAEVRACDLCAPELPLGPRPVLRGRARARILIIGQAPGTKVHATGIPWNDPSGRRLRQWMGLADETFYDEARIAIMPMGFCYPGRLARGGDQPPRPECAPLWHPRLLAALPQIRLTLLVGAYAQKYYLGAANGRTLAATVGRWREFLPSSIPTPHPSWRTSGWQKRHPWFATELLPALRERVTKVLAG